MNEIEQLVEEFKGIISRGVIHHRDDRAYQNAKGEELGKSTDVVILFRNPQDAMRASEIMFFIDTGMIIEGGDVSQARDRQDREGFAIFVRHNVDEFIKHFGDLALGVIKGPISFASHDFDEVLAAQKHLPREEQFQAADPRLTKANTKAFNDMFDTLYAEETEAAKLTNLRPAPEDLQNTIAEFVANLPSPLNPFELPDEELNEEHQFLIETFHHIARGDCYEGVPENEDYFDPLLAADTILYVGLHHIAEKWREAGMPLEDVIEKAKAGEKAIDKFRETIAPKLKAFRNIMSASKEPGRKL